MVDLSLTPNPDDRALWPMGSDADWIRGSDVANNEHPGVLAQRHQWIVPNRLFAESMVKANSELVTSIIGALLSWRTCTVDQLRAGLSVKGADNPANLVVVELRQETHPKHARPV